MSSGEQQLKILLEGYTAGTLSDSQRKEFFRLVLAHPDFAAGIIQQMDVPDNIQAPALTNEEQVLIEQTIFALGKTGNNPVHLMRREENKPKRIALHWVKYAAAVALSIGIGAYLFTTSTKKNQPVQQQVSRKMDILPGSEKAILTLSDGTQITLDSAANGAIAQQGNSSVVKLKNGEVRYDLKGASSGDVVMNTMSTPRGGQYRLILPDGTQIWLNAASSVTYPVVFTGNERKIKISGEVYLEVAQNKTRPFIVDIDGRSVVQVLGTSFNINSYADEEVIKTTLIDGSVKVSNIILKPMQQAVIGKNIIVRSNANINQVLAWKNGYFNFENLGLREMARQIERWYDIKVEFQGSFKDLSLRGEMDRGVQLPGIIRFFNSYGFKTKLEGRVLILTK